MKVVALISGGKDSCYNMLQCVKYGHEIVALANLKPAISQNKDEIDSFMYQTVGHQAIQAYADAMELPLYRIEITGSATQQSLHYSLKNSSQDHIIDEEKHPEVEAVSSGAILSNYQRNRVENVCSRLGVVSLAYLWQRDQRELLREMIDAGVEAIIIKVAAMGLSTQHLGQTIASLFPYLCSLNTQYGSNICGEGGEYESFTLDCPLFKKRIVVDAVDQILHSQDAFAPVAYLNITKYHLEPKTEHSLTWQSVSSTLALVPSKPVMPLQTMVSLPHNVCPQVKELPSYLYIYDTILSNNTSVPLQLETLFIRVQEVLDRLGYAITDIFYVYLYLKNMSDFAAVNAVYKKKISIMPPSRACIGMPLGNATIAMECICQKRHACSVLHVQSISEWAPACIGPYSQAYTVDKIVYLAGQIGLDPPTMQLPVDPLQQASLAFSNTNQVLKAMNSDFSNLLYGTIYVTDITYQEAVVELLKKYIPSIEVQSRVCWVQCASLPRGADVELQVVAVVQNTEEAPQSHHEETTLTVNTHLISCYCHVVQLEETVLFVRCSFRTSSNVHDLDSQLLLLELLSYLEERTARQAFHWKDTLFVRIYYTPSLPFKHETTLSSQVALCFVPVCQMAEDIIVMTEMFNFPQNNE